MVAGAYYQAQGLEPLDAERLQGTTTDASDGDGEAFPLQNRSNSELLKISTLAIVPRFFT